MNSHMDPEFAAALRRTLLEQAKPQRSRVPGSYRRTALVGLGTIVGLGAMGAAAAAVFGIPGADVETSLSAPVELNTVGRASVLLGDVPERANGVHFEFTCTSPGTYVIDEAGIVLSCGKADAGRTSAGVVSVDTVKDGTLEVRSESKGTWELRVWYVATNQIPLARNDNGETYGVESEELQPDLIYVVADNGKDGYVRRADVEAGRRHQPTNPDDAVNHNPKPFEVPVYQSDGKTVIGTFTWAN